ncbi:MAG: hypothetical protein ACYC1D_07895 [Acidimicrobiales bacterium]
MDVSTSDKQAFGSGGSNIADALEIGSETKAGSVASDVAGRAIGVLGVGLSLYVTVEDCEHGTVQQCVGDTVGLAFSVACLAVSSGVGSVACSLLGAGLAYVISAYGPQIAQGLADLGQYEIEGATIAIDAIGAGFSAAGTAIGGAFAIAGDSMAAGFTQAATAIASGFGTAVGAVATGFNEAGSAISSGFDSGVATLEQAGYSAVQMANVLKGTFDEGLTTVVNELNNLAYDVDGVTAALMSTFDQLAPQAAALLQSLGYADMRSLKPSWMGCPSSWAASRSSSCAGSPFACTPSSWSPASIRAPMTLPCSTGSWICPAAMPWPIRVVHREACRPVRPRWLSLWSTGPSVRRFTGPTMPTAPASPR